MGGEINLLCRVHKDPARDYIFRNENYYIFTSHDEYSLRISRKSFQSYWDGVK